MTTEDGQLRARPGPAAPGVTRGALGRRRRQVGGLFALLAAATFGVTTPFVHAFGEGAGTFGTSMLLYAGAVVVTSVRTGARGPGIPGREVPRLVGIALLGAVVAPALLVWGVERTDGASAALALGVEMPFTVILARLLFRERVSRRLRFAVLAMVASTLCLALPRGAALSWSPRVGVVAVTAAALAWASDSALMRPLSACDARTVVSRKSAIGAFLSFLLARAVHEPVPVRASLVVPLLALGALGYGFSLQFYLLAQRRIGAARAASLFAIAPLCGAVAGVVSGRAVVDAALLSSALACTIAVGLQLTEEAAPEARPTEPLSDPAA